MGTSERGELAIYRWGDDPTAADVAVPTLRKLLSEGRTAEAADYAAKLRRRYPNSSDIEVLAGDVALLGGDAPAALALYRSAKRVRWTSALALRIAAAERRLGREGAAEAELADYLTQHPQDRAMAAVVGRTAAAHGEWRRAALLLGHAALLPGGPADPRLIADLAEAQLHLGDRERALANARRAYALQRTSPRATSVLAAAMAAGEGPAEGAGLLLAKARALGAEPALASR
jgi:predicted Zn-dependent protease